jgi:hypothetical protein
MIDMNKLVTSFGVTSCLSLDLHVVRHRALIINHKSKVSLSQWLTLSLDKLLAHVLM